MLILVNLCLALLYFLNIRPESLPQYHDFARPEYSGFAAIFCREIAEVAKELWPKLEEDFFQGSRVVTITNDEISGDSIFRNNTSMMLFRRPTGELGYIIHLALPLELLQGKSESSLINLALQELEKAGFPDSLKQLVRISPPAKMQQRSYYIHRATISDSIQVSNPTDLNTEADPAEILPSQQVYSRNFAQVIEAL